MTDFPTLGLKFDLAEMAAGLQKLAQGKVAFEEVGNAAEKAAADTKEATRATREGGDAAQSAGQKRQRAADSATRAERETQRQIRETIAQLRLLNDVARALQLEQAVRARMKALGAQQIAEAAREVQRAGVQLVTVVDNQATKVQAAMSRLIAPPALAGAERGRMQRQLDAIFGAVEDSVDANTIQLVTKIDRQAMRIRGAMSRLIAPAALSGAARAARQAELDTTFNAIPAGGGGGTPAQAMSDNRSIFAKTAAMLGLGRAYEMATSRGSGFFKNLGQVRVALLNARFAAALFIGALTLGPVAAMADAMVSLEARTKLYADRASDVPTIMENLYRTAQRARQPLEGIATLYTRLAPLATQLGRSQSDMLRVVETVAKSFTLGGAAASEATASAQQFAQALSSNRFGGDELRSVAENAPVLLAAIAEGVNKINPSLNLNAATFIKWAQEGNANAAIMVEAIENARGKIDEMFRTMPVTISQGISVLGNAVQYAVGQIDRLAGAGGGRLSTEIAEMIASFARFVESEKFINGVVAALDALRTIIEVVSRVIGFLVDNATILLGVLAALLVVRTVTAAFTAMSLAFAIAGRSMTVMSVTTGASAAAMKGLAAAGKGALAMFGGPWGIAIAAATAGLLWLRDTAKKTQEAIDGVESAGRDLYSALDRARTVLDAYGNSTARITDLMSQAIGVEKERTEGMDEASIAAQNRAEMDKMMAVAAITTAMNDLRAARAAAERGAAMDKLAAGILRVGAALKGWATLEAINDRNMAAALDRRAADARRAAGEYGNLLDTAQAALNEINNGNFRATTPRDGSGVPTLNGADDEAEKQARGMQSALKRIADFRADLATMQKEVAATEVGFFGPGGLDALAAERAELEALANYGVQALDEISNARLREAAATEVQLAREVALKRLETDRITQMIQNRRETDLQTAALEAQNEALFDADNAIRAYYQDGARTIAGFKEAMTDSADAQARAAIIAEEHAIAAQFGVATIDDLTGELQTYARALLAARTANILLTREQEQQRQAAEADNAREKEIADLTDYAAAVNAGTRALQDFNREQQIRDALAASGPNANVVAVTADVDRLNQARYDAMLADRLRDAQEAAIDAALSGAERERDLRGLILQYMLAHRDATFEQARAAVEGATREYDLRQRIARMQAETSDEIRRSFIETGKLDFSSLKENLKRSIRQAVYDGLLAKPIDIVVKAVVDVVTRGLDALLKKIMGANAGKGEGGIFGDLGSAFEGGMDKLGDQLKGLLDKLPKSWGAALKSAGQFAGQAGAGYTIGTTIADTFGIKGSGEGWQAWLDAGASIIGTMIGGPIGGTIATIASRLIGSLFGDKKRPLGLTGVEVRNGQFTSIGTIGYDGMDTTEIDAAGKQLATLLNRLSKVFDFDLTKANGLYSLFGWTAGENTKALGGEGFFGGMLRGISSLRGMSLDQIKGSALGRGVDLSQVKDAEEAIDRILRETLIRIGDAVDNPFSEAEKALIRAAESLEDAAAQIFAARNIEKTLERQLLQFTNPRDYALANLRDQQVERRQGIRDLIDQGLITADRIPGIESLLQQIESAEIRDALERFATGVDGAAASLKQLQDAQAKIAEYAEALLTGKLSPLSPGAQLELSGNRFNETLALAQGGNLQALEDITGLAGEYLSAAQQFYGSGGQYGEIFDQVYQALSALSTQEFNDPLIDALEEQMDLLRQAIEDGFGNLIDVITGGGGGGGGGDDDVVTGGGGGGRGGGGGGPPVDPGTDFDYSDFLDRWDRGVDRINNQLAGVAEAMVRSNEHGTERVVTATVERSSMDSLLSGGRVRQSRAAAA